MKQKLNLTDEQRKKILQAIGKHYDPHCCDNCANYWGCSGGSRFGPPCSDCNEVSLSGYEPDKYATESDEALFDELEKILNDDK